MAEGGGIGNVASIAAHDLTWVAATAEWGNQDWGTSLMVRGILLAGLAGLIANPALALDQAQPGTTAVAAPVAQPAPAQAAVLTASSENILRAGTPVPLKLREMLTTKGKTLKVGQRFQMEVADAVVLNGVTVIPAGTPATGEITDVRNKGMWGKSGKINARAVYLRANGRQIRLTGQLDDKGTTGTAAVVGAVVLLPVAGFFMTGTSAELPIGTPMTAFLDEDVPFSVGAAATPAPMMVPATATPGG